MPKYSLWWEQGKIRSIKRPWKGSARSKILPFFSARSKNLLTLLQGHKILQGHKVKEKTSARSEKNCPKIARSFYFDSKIARSPDCEFAGRSQGHEKKALEVRNLQGQTFSQNTMQGQKISHKILQGHFFPYPVNFFCTLKNVQGHTLWEKMCKVKKFSLKYCKVKIFLNPFQGLRSGFNHLWVNKSN